MTATDTPGAASAPLCQCCLRELHGPDLTAGRLVCPRCEDRIARDLADVAALWRQLPAYTVKGTGGPSDGVKVAVSGPDGSAAPGNLGALDLLAGGVVGRLIVHEDAWRRALGWTATPWRGDQDQTLTGLLAFLETNLHWACCAYDDVDGLDHDLGEVLRDMRAVITGDRRRITELATPCPLPAVDQPDDSDVDEPAACGGVLVYDPQASRIRCRTCRTVLGHEAWADLAVDAGVIALAEAPLARRAIADAA